MNVTPSEWTMLIIDHLESLPERLHYKEGSKEDQKPGPEELALMEQIKRDIESEWTPAQRLERTGGRRFMGDGGGKKISGLSGRIHHREFYSD